MVIKPKALKPSATLGLVATSSPIHLAGTEPIDRCFSFLQGKGFKIVEAGNCRKLIGHAAGTLGERVAEFHRFFADPTVDGLLAYWGGYNSHQMLEYLDFDLIGRHPKPFIGYSDVTALQLGIYAKTGMITFCGPAGITFGKPLVPAYTWHHFESVLMRPTQELNLEPSTTFSDNHWWEAVDKQMIFDAAPGWNTFRSGCAEGRLIGGNGGTMLLLAGTEFWPSLDGAILFIEDDECESPETISRIFFHLRHVGAFDTISGLMIGRFPRSVGFKQDDSLEMILEDALRGYTFPVLTEVDFGHTDPLLTLPIGVRCRMNAGDKRLELLESAVQ